jgi:hypothetical protein
MSQFRAWWPAALLMGAAMGCDPRLTIPDIGGAPSSGQGGGAAGVQVTLEPPAALDAAPPVLRVRVTAGGDALDPGLLALVSGSVGPAQLLEVARGKVSATLAKRVVPALAWAEDGAVVLAPTTALEPGASYTLAIGDRLDTVALTTAPLGGVPLLSRVWPPADGAAGDFAVWCGDARLPRFDAAASLAPGALPGWIRRGAVTAGAGERCLRFEPSQEGDADAHVAPPLVSAAADPSVQVRLDPSPIGATGAPSSVVALACEADEIAFGPGCVKLADDRLYGRSPAAPVLWAVAGAGVDAVFAAWAGDPFVISGLPPSTDVTLDVAAVDARGTVLRMLLTAATLAPMPHMIINEVLANPLGPEPQQEWVEIVNDGPAPAVLDGYTLTDSGGDTALPPATLAPGAFALLVNQAFAEQDGLDAAPAPGTLLLRVPHLGKGGLSNAGEALVLSDGSGSVVSRFPARPAPKAGFSVARRTPAAPDARSLSFARAAPSPGRTNVW